MREKVGIVIGVLLFLFCCGVGLYYLENHEGVYYARIDNAKIKKLDTTSDMKYEYTLPCYNEKGNKKELTFKTRRELKEWSYSKLITRSLGVHSWEEQQYDDLPQKVQEKLNS